MTRNPERLVTGIPLVPLDLRASFIALDDQGAATPLTVDEDFWANPDPRIESGRLVSMIHSDADWTTWEMHPAGDELIHLVSGAMVLVVETASGHQRIAMAAGQTALVPRGIWHTADFPAPGDAIYITPGQDTQHRPRDPD